MGVIECRWDRPMPARGAPPGQWRHLPPFGLDSLRAPACPSRTVRRGRSGRPARAAARAAWRSRPGGGKLHPVQEEAMSPLALLLFWPLVATAAGLPGAPARGPSPGWGSVKGRVVLDARELPVNPEVAVTSDRKHCLSK